MGNLSAYPELYEDLQTWDKATRATVANVDKRLNEVLTSVTSSAATQTALTALGGTEFKLASTLPGPTGAAKVLPLLISRNCLLHALSINDTYDRIKTGLTILWDAALKKIANAKTYLNSLKAIETVLASSKSDATAASRTIAALDDAGVAKLTTDTTGWVAQKANITTDATVAAYTDPRKPNAKQALVTLQLTQPAALVTYVQTTIAEYAQYRIALTA